MTSPPDLPARGWVLYDGGCALCRRFVPRWHRALARRGFRPAALQEPWVAERAGMPPDELVQEFRVLERSGVLHSGAEAYRALMRRIWWAWPLWLLTGLPLARTLFAWVYRKVARHRHGLSCLVPGGES